MDWVCAAALLSLLTLGLGFGLVLAVRSKRRQAHRAAACEHALRQEVEEFRAIFDATGDFIFIVDPESLALVDCNRRAQEILGYDQAEIIALGIAGLSAGSPYDLENAKPLIRSAAGGAPLTVEWLIKAKDGRALCVEAHLRSASPSGHNRLIASCRDISRRKTAERSAEAAREKYRDIFEMAPVGIFRSLPAGRYLTVNSWLAALYGYDGPEDMTAAISDIATQTYADPWQRREIMRSFEQGSDSVKFESRRRRKDGSVFWAEVSMRAVRDRQGDIVCFDGFLTDLSARKALEEELLLAKDQAETANRAKSEFLANMSHEIRTPLSGMLAIMEDLTSEELTLDQRQSVGLASQAGTNLLGILNDILDLSKIEAGKIEIAVEPYCPRQVLDAVLGIFALQAKNKGLTLTCRVDPGVPDLALGDSARLRQILFNLTGNAIKFTHAGGIEIAVDAKDSAGMLRFTIKDTGVGISASKLASVFEPFTQADGSFSRGHQGTGLGLSIVKRLSTLLGGEVTLDSRPGHGTTATLTIPLKPAGYSITGPSFTGEARPRQRIRVLLAEDDFINRLAAKRILERMGQTVMLAQNGREALDILAREDIDMILLDIQMPVMDGIETVRRIRAGEAGRGKQDVPILALTAHAMPGDREFILASGCDDYLAKPVSSAALSAAIGRLCPGEGERADRVAPGQAALYSPA